VRARSQKRSSLLRFFKQHDVVILARFTEVEADDAAIGAREQGGSKPRRAYDPKRALGKACTVTMPCPDGSRRECLLAGHVHAACS